MTVDLTLIFPSFIGYACAGAFLGLAYFDYYYTLVAIIVLCRTVLLDEKRSAASEQTARLPLAEVRRAVPHAP